MVSPESLKKQSVSKDIAGACHRVRGITSGAAGEEGSVGVLQAATDADTADL